MSFSIEQNGFTLADVQPGEGWHCSHFFYSFDRSRVDPTGFAVPEFAETLSSTRAHAPARLQTGIVSGHKADFSLMMMDPDPLKIESVHQSLINGPFGIRCEWSYVSFSEISEYVQSPEQYAERLKSSGEDPSSSAFATKVQRYADRLEKMNYQRLTPDFPDWPVSCFYPMNKWRLVGANWFMLSADERHQLMSEHARSGIQFAGKVTQLITVGVGIDDWEWGVTLWATNPKYLKDIVYGMRFDEASARYGEFGPFYTSYRCPPKNIPLMCLNSG